MNDKKIGIIAKTSVGDINIIRVLHLLIFASLSTDIIGCKFFVLNIIFFLLFFGYDSKCIYSCTILKGNIEISTAPNAEKNGSSNIEMGKKWYENIIFSFIYAIISMKVIY